MSVRVWHQVNECILPGHDRAGFNSHLFLRKFMDVYRGRRARDLNSELPEVGFSFPPSELLLCKGGGAWTERDLQLSGLMVENLT